MEGHSKYRVAIREPIPSDSAAFLQAVRRSRSLHRGWVSPPSNPAAFAGYLERIASEGHRGFLVTRRDTGAIAGVINMNNIILGNFRSAFLGYYGFLPHAGEGLMTAGMRLVLQHAFHELKLHRLEANIQPTNEASLALVRRCGFVKEGFSRRYLKISARWADHERWAILSEDFRMHSRTTPKPDSR